jgi:hypothetical protein
VVYCNTQISNHLKYPPCTMIKTLRLSTALATFSVNIFLGLYSK